MDNSTIIFTQNSNGLTGIVKKSQVKYMLVEKDSIDEYIVKIVLHDGNILYAKDSINNLNYQLEKKCIKSEN